MNIYSFSITKRSKGTNSAKKKKKKPNGPLFLWPTQLNADDKGGSRSQMLLGIRDNTSSYFLFPFRLAFIRSCTNFGTPTRKKIENQWLHDLLWEDRIEIGSICFQSSCVWLIVRIFFYGGEYNSLCMKEAKTIMLAYRKLKCVNKLIR